jgi:hypothetical protein
MKRKGKVLLSRQFTVTDETGPRDQGCLVLQWPALGQNCAVVLHTPALGHNCAVVLHKPELGHNCAVVLHRPALGHNCAVVLHTLTLGHNCAVMLHTLALGHNCAVVLHRPALEHNCAVVLHTPALGQPCCSVTHTSVRTQLCCSVTHTSVRTQLCCSVTLALGHNCAVVLHTLALGHNCAVINDADCMKMNFDNSLRKVSYRLKHYTKTLWMEKMARIYTQISGSSLWYSIWSTHARRAGCVPFWSLQQFQFCSFVLQDIVDDGFNVPRFEFIHYTTHTIQALLPTLGSIGRSKWLWGIIQWIKLFIKTQVNSNFLQNSNGLSFVKRQ